MCLGRAWPVWIAFAASMHSAYGVRIEVKDAGRTSVVLAADGTNVREAKLIQQQGGDAVHEIDATWSCTEAQPGGPRLLIISSGRAAAYREPAELCSALQSGPIVVRLEPPKELTVHFWLFSDDARSRIKDEITNTNWIFRRNLISAVLKPEFHDGLSVKPIADSAGGSNPNRAFL